MPIAPDALIGQIIADRYRVLSLIGEGGMGRVYLAEHVHMGRKSAVKVLSPALAVSAEAITRFHREAANASRINHPNVAAIYDFGEASEGVMYLAMEYVEGETLTALLRREGRLDIARAAQLTKQAADALASAHHFGIVHRDLKPDNIMVARNMEGGDLVKVVDFGIAKSMGPSSQTVTTAGISIGTPEYMSPEQLAGEKLDARTDVYSLAVVLFHMLTGVLPYPQVTSRETLVKRLTSPPRKLQDVAADVEWPVGLERALDRALAPAVDDRYSSVGDFGRDVLAAAELSVAHSVSDLTSAAAPATPTRRLAPSEPAHASPPRAIFRRRFDRRLIVVGALVVVAAWVAAFAYRHSVERPHARLARPAKSTSRR